jgi:molecular chaperone DnaK (HSP70)
LILWFYLHLEFGEVDKEKRDITELSNEVDALCYSVDTSLAEPGVPDTLKERARTKIDELRDALERNDYDSVKSDLSMLKEISAEISQQNSSSEV